MAFKIILISGPICSGKTELALGFKEKYDAIVFKTNELLEKKVKNAKSMTRQAFQKAGEKLDRSDDGKWVADALADELNEQDISEGIIVVDSVRIQGQARHIRKVWGSSAFSYGSQVYHVHLTADEKALAKRYKNRKGKLKEFRQYADVTKSKTEKNIEVLAEISDVVIDTENIELGDVLIRASAHLDLYPRTTTQLVDVLIGGQYGSEGKGHIAAHIAPDYDCLMRVGGPNAGHKVYEKLEDKTDVDTYHHLPSGTKRNPKAKIVIGAGAVIRLDVLEKEMRFTELDPSRLFIDRHATIIEDEDIKVEAGNLVKKISSTGQGVGSATARKILERDPDSDLRLAKDIPQLKPFISDTVAILESIFKENGRVLLEGTQGTSLSLHHGEYPYVTSRDTTVSGCIAEAGISPRRVRKVIMVCRTYPIRVGGPSGPMKNEISKRQISLRSGVSYTEIRKTEKTSTTKKNRRIGEFDWEQLQRAVLLNGPTEIAISFADYLNVENRKARRFEQLDPKTIRFIEEVERVSGVPVSLISTRFDYRSIIDRRAW